MATIVVLNLWPMYIHGQVQRFSQWRFKGCACFACRFCVSRKGGTGRGGWDHPQGDMHMVAARLGSESAMVGTGWANSFQGCMDKFATLTFQGVDFRQGRLLGL